MTRTTPTLADVARLAGVSTATVSRCLNAPARVVEETRARVMEAVEVLGYTPNFGARIMAARRSHTIGAVIPTMDNAIFARGLQAFEEELHCAGYTLLVASTAYRPEIEGEHIRTLVARGADGLLLIGHDRDPAINTYLSRQEIPALIAWSVLEDAPLPSVGFDNRAAMSALAEQVIAFGHHRIAMISGICAGNDRARLRVEGLRAALAAHGHDTATLCVIETAYGIEEGAAAFETLMSRDPRPTAVLCGNDVLAAGAICRAQEMGLDVPGDISITGFDDIELARIVTPPLSTVHVPHRDMGRIAARTLVDMVEGRGTRGAVTLPTRIEMRGSLAGIAQPVPKWQQGAE